MKRYIFIITLLVIGALQGCNHFLDTVPDNRTVLDTEEAIGELLVTAYPAAHYYHICETMSDNAHERDVSSDHSRIILNREMYHWEDNTQTTQDHPIYVWTNFYQAIAAANMALEAIEEMGTPESLLPSKGEALLCRAFAHFLLVNLWGEHYDPATADKNLGVPYVTETEKKVLVQYKRETVAKVYEMIEKDLTEGFPLINDEIYKVPKYHFTQAAAAAFASRFYLYKGEWEKVIEYANIALGENPRSKMRSLRGPLLNQPDKDLYQYRYFGSDEPSQLLMVVCTSNWCGDFSSSSLRFGMTKEVNENVITNAKVVGNSGTGGIYYVISTYNNGRVQMRKFYEYREYSTATTFRRKTAGPMLMVEDVIFNRAEAYTMLKNYSKALEDINLIISERVPVNKNTPEVLPAEVDQVMIKNYYNRDVRYYTQYCREYGVEPYMDGIPLYPDLEPFYKDQIDEDQMNMLKCIVDWRRKEFMQEGLRWFDIKRFHLPVVHTFEWSYEKAVVLDRYDLRRALQIPPEAQGYGLLPNPR